MSKKIMVSTYDLSNFLKDNLEDIIRNRHCSAGLLQLAILTNGYLQRDGLGIDIVTHQYRKPTTSKMIGAVRYAFGMRRNTIFFLPINFFGRLHGEFLKHCIPHSTYRRRWRTIARAKHSF